MGLWADMSEVERVAHSIRHGNKYHLKDSKAGLLEEAAAYNDDRSQHWTNGTPHAAASDPSRPDGVSQYVWDRVMADTMAGLPTTGIATDEVARDALIAAGHEDWVKRAHEDSIRKRASVYGANGADDAWGDAQHEWYTERYGNFYDGNVNNRGNGFTFGGGSNVAEDPNAVTGKPTGIPPGYGGGGGGAGGGGGNASSNPDFGPAVEMTNRAGNTPFIDAYMRSRESAKKEGPVTGMMKKYME